MSKALAAINQALATHNGRRRERTLTESDILRVIGECLADGRATTGGGTVANKYGYPAVQTVAVAEKQGKQVIVSIGQNNASKGSAQRPNPRYGSASVITLSLATARKLTQQQRIESGKFLPKHLHRVIVTREHSAAVGNCSTYTERVAKLCGDGESATAKTVFDACKKFFPSQLDRAVKAIMYASTHQEPANATQETAQAAM